MPLNTRSGARVSSLDGIERHTPKLIPMKRAQKTFSRLRLLRHLSRRRRNRSANRVSRNLEPTRSAARLLRAVLFSTPSNAWAVRYGRKVPSDGPTGPWLAEIHVDDGAGGAHRRDLLPVEGPANLKHPAEKTGKFRALLDRGKNSSTFKTTQQYCKRSWNGMYLGTAT